MDASVVAPLTVGLDKWAQMGESIRAAAKDVDIVIPVRLPEHCSTARAGPRKGTRGPSRLLA